MKYQASVALGGAKMAYNTVSRSAMTFRNRSHAGTQLASKLAHYACRDNVIVLTLPMGGVIVGHEIAKALSCPLDVIITRKIAFPDQPDVAIGVVSETGTVVRNNQLISTYKIPEDYIRHEIARQREEIEWRVALYRGGRRLPALQDKTVILVDDGIVTGSIMKSAILTLVRDNVDRLVAAMTVAERNAEREIHVMVDELVCLETSRDMVTIDSFYKDFSMVSDEEIMDILMAGRSGAERAEPDPAADADDDIEMAMGYMSRAGQIS